MKIRIPVFLTLMATLGLSLTACLIASPKAKIPTNAEISAIVAVRQCASFDKAIPLILKHEGHLTNNPKDPGGITNYGLSYRYLDALVKLRPDIGDMLDENHNDILDAYDIEHIDINEAKKLYKEEWWDKHQFGLICDQQLATKLFDLSINMGEHQIILILQRAYQQIEGEEMPKNYLEAINNLTANKRHDLLVAVCVHAEHYYINLAQKRPQFKVFLKGWLRRVRGMG